MKVVYLTWGETPRSYGIFGSQVLGQFAETKKYARDDEFYFISGLPLVHSGLVRERLAYKEEIQKVKKRLGDISFSIIPIFAPQNFVNSSKVYFPFMHYFSNGLLAKKLKEINPDIVHCRSYHATYAAIKAKQKQNLSYKIIFDGRGLWPEEMAMKANFSQHDENYRFLKEIEKNLLEKSDRVVAVSDTMKQHYEAIVPSRIDLVYLSSAFEKIDEKTNKSKDMITFCYLGALSNDTWHTIQDLKNLYFKIREKSSISTKLLVITTSDHNAIKDEFKDLSESELELTSTKTNSELMEKLKNVDFGLLPYRSEIENYFQEVIGYTMLGTKTVEFIAAGIPVIVNQACGGAAVLIDKFGAGITYNPNTFEEITEENLQKYINDGRSAERSLLAKELFDYQTNAAKYYEIYKSLV